MNKISVEGWNTFCPQALYLYGTYTDDGRANYGLFCWCAYCHVDALKFVACIGEDKLTRDLIRKNGKFSATVVTHELFCEADYCGMTTGREVDKSRLIESENGGVLDVPVPVKGMWTLELEVDETLTPSKNPDSDIYICSIKSVRADERLTDESLTLDEKLALLRPVMTISGEYIETTEKSLGKWGMPMQSIDKQRI